MFMCEKLADVGVGAARGGQASCARCRHSRAFRADQEENTAHEVALFGQCFESLTAKLL